MSSRSALILAVLVVATAAWVAGPYGRLLVVLPLLLFGPGYLIERALPLGGRPVLLVRPALWLGLSLAVVPLLYQWATAFQMPIGAPLLQALAVLCGLAVAWAAWGEPSAQTRADVLWAAAFLGVFGLTMLTRYLQAEKLALPPWVDSVHHTLLVRVVADRGLAPYSLRPFLPVDELPYHWGYHAWTAAVVQVSGAELAFTVLWVGQALNTLHVLTVAALANWLWRRPVAGVVAGIVVGLVSIFPAYYLSWGRYTQLTGLLMLPPLVIVWLAWLDAARLRWRHQAADEKRVFQGGLALPATLPTSWRRYGADEKRVFQGGPALPATLPTGWRHWLLLLLLGAGLSLVHFRVLVLALSYLAVATLLWAAGSNWRTIRERAAGALALALAAIGLTLPWLLLIAQRRLVPAVADPGQLAGGGNYNALSLDLLWAGQNRMLAVLALAAALWLIWRRARVVVAVLLWSGVMLLLANPWLVSYLLPGCGVLLLIWGLLERRRLALGAGALLLLANPALLQLPYSWLITNEVVIISLFVPFGVLIGGGAAMAEECWLATPSRRVLRASAGFALVALALWGTWQLRGIVNETTILATEADVAAINWAAENTPRDAYFLTNAASWLPSANRGTDAGWWLLPLAGRRVSTPPVLFDYGPPDYVKHVQAISGTVAQFGPGREQELMELIRREGITHIYLGTRGGPLTANVFGDRTMFTPIYERDGVTIFEVVGQ